MQDTLSLGLEYFKLYSLNFSFKFVDGRIVWTKIIVDAEFMWNLVDGSTYPKNYHAHCTSHVSGKCMLCLTLVSSNVAHRCTSK